jgi:hypothetical protein
MSHIRAKGHLQVKQRRGGRVYYAYWEDDLGRKRGTRLGPAHVRDTGRRTQRGAVIWRAGDGPKPTPEHLTPREAEDRLNDILRAVDERSRDEQAAASAVPLHRAAEAWLAARRNERGLKRSTVADYEDMFERLYRDLGAETPLQELGDGRLGLYFGDFMAERPLGERAAREAIARGEDVTEVEVVRWTAQPPGSQAHEVSTQAEAVALARKIGGTWKHRRRGCYRVVAAGSDRPKRVSRATAEKLGAEGWVIKERVSKRWMLRTPAAAQTRNKYCDVLSAALDHAVREGWLEANPLVNVRRASNRQARQRILRRDDFYDPSEVDRLLRHTPSSVEEAFWLCGAHAGFRLPGEALGLRWGAVDFEANVIRPYDNWVRNASAWQASEPRPRDRWRALRVLRALHRAQVALAIKVYAVLLAVLLTGAEIQCLLVLVRPDTRHADARSVLEALIAGFVALAVTALFSAVGGESEV